MMDEKSRGSLTIFYKVVIITILTTISTYIALRSYYVPITYDEAFTILKHVPNSYSVILGLKIALVEEFANNHSLNTAAIKFLLSYLPMSEFVVRIPNLLAGILFIFIYLLILIKLKINDWKLVILFLFGISSSVLLEFFSLARGYGLSIALFFAGYYVWLRTDREINPRFFLRLSFAGILFSLALIANLSIIFAILGVSITETIYFFVEIYRKNNQSNKFDFISSIKLLLYYILSVSPSLFLLKKVYGKTLPIARTLNLFYVQNRDGYLSGSLMSLAKDWTPILTQEQQLLYLKISSFLFFPAVLFFIYYIVLKKNFQKIKYQHDIQVLGTFIFVSIAPSLMDIFLHTGFPYERSAIYIIPIYALFTSVLIRILSESKSYLILSYRYLLIGIVFFTTILSLFGFNIRKTLYWAFDSTSRYQYAALKRELDLFPSKKDKMIAVGVDWYLEPSFNFYRIQSQDENLFLPVKCESPLHSKFDYIFLLDGSDARIPDQSYIPSNLKELEKWKVIEYWPETGVRLLRNEKMQE